ncbi:MAG: hypothetical protein GC179_26180 [Anaerolineaceae bacterium]|nr:hypothetical protein [Anaerolineaceae bacterium]
MIRKFFKKNRLTFIIAIVALAVLPVLAAWVSSANLAPPAPTPRSVVGVAYPRNYRQDFTQYATIQRPDGTIRDVYMNAVGIAAVKGYHILPIGTVIAIEGYNALKTADGSYVTDANGHYVKGDPLPFVHVREKRIDWTAADFTSSARNGSWNFGSFDFKTGATYNESLNACFLCHNTAPEDFTYSVEQMADFAYAGAPVYFMCRTTGRTACE